MATNAISLNGSTQYGQIDNFAGLENLTNYTLEFWVKNHASSVAYAPIVGIEVGTTVFQRFSTENGVGNQGFNFATVYAGTDADGYESDSRLITSDFVHVAMVHNATIKMSYILINGVENNGYNLQEIGTSTLQSSNGMVLHVGLDVTPIPDKYFQGSIGGFLRLWTRALTGAEIYHNYNKTLTPANETGLVVNCNFSEGSGTVVDNDATAGEDLDLYNTPTWVTGPTVSAKSYSNSYHFNQVAASTDDGEENRSTTAMGLTSGDYEISADGGAPQHFGIRFLAIDIPAGAVIQAAYIRFTPNTSINTGTVNVDIYGNDVDDASTFTTTNADISGRTRTTATVVFTAGNVTVNNVYSTNDIKTIIQEIIDRAGWASGNDMAFMFIAPNDTNTRATFHSYNGQVLGCAMLHIEYTVAGSDITKIASVAIASVKKVAGISNT